MPIEIRELVIKMTVNKPLSSKSNRGFVNNSISRDELRNLKREILEECIEKTKDLIEKKSNR